MINKINSSMNNTKPKDANKLEIVKVNKAEKYSEEKVLSENGWYRNLYQPDEQHDDQRRRATDNIWSENTYKEDRVIEKAGNYVLYYLQDKPDSTFVREDLMHILQDTQYLLSG